MNKINKEKTLHRIQALRRENGWSQKDLAGRINMSQANYSRVENGEVELTISLINQLMFVFQVKLPNLLVLRIFDNNPKANKMDDYTQTKLILEEAESIQDFLSTMIEEARSNRKLLKNIEEKLSDRAH